MSLKPDPPTICCDGPGCGAIHHYNGSPPVPADWAYLQKGEHRFDFCGWQCLVFFVDELDSNLPEKCGQCRQLRASKLPSAWNCEHPFTLATRLESLAVEVTAEPPDGCPLRLMSELGDEDLPDPMGDCPYCD